MSDTEAPRTSDSAAMLRRPDMEAIPNLGRMMSKTRRIGIWADRIRAAYFSDPAKRLEVKRGDRILRQGEDNDRLYYVVSGCFICTIMVDTPTGDREPLELFQRRAGDFIGVRSFFADSGLAVFDATAEEDSVVMWMDHKTQAVDTDRYGSLREQFFPVIVKELEHRQFRLTRAAREGASARVRMHRAEDMATLGQFAAGLAHELNNATSVLMSSSQHLGRQLGEYFRQFAPDLAEWYERGMQPSATLSSADVRIQARKLEQRHRVDYETAKDLVRMLGSGDIRKLPRDIDSLRAAWMTGRSCRDILYASKHAANIIHSIKQLSAGGHARREPTDLGESFDEAVELLRDALKGVDIRTEVQPGIPKIQGNIGELMQIWLNIVKNAYEAMRDAGTPEPRIDVKAVTKGGDAVVSITDNGPGIPEAFRDRMFQPNITTKTGEGTTMGLGLGLYIVKRLVDSYHGRIEVASGDRGTTFTVHLPMDGGDAPARPHAPNPEGLRSDGG